MLVDLVFEVANGLSGMKRCVLLRICDLMGSRTNNIRILIGTCQEQYEFKKHSYFLFVRRAYIRTKFRFNPKEGFDSKVTPFGIDCTFTREYWDNKRSVFLDTLVNEGIFRWSVQITYATTGISKLCIGAAPSNVEHQCFSSFLGEVKGTCAFMFGKSYDHNLEFSLSGVINGGDISYPKGVPNGSEVSVEIDNCAKALSFFVGSTRVPFVISDVDKVSYLGMSGMCSSFLSISFRRLVSPTPASPFAAATTPTSSTTSISTLTYPSPTYYPISTSVKGMINALLTDPLFSETGMTYDYAEQLLAYFLEDESEDNPLTASRNYILNTPPEDE